MSDAVSNAEIEDVLSSIRRLVSESRDPGRSGTRERGGSAVQDRLVLTPALRVVETPAQTPEPESAPDSAPADVLPVKAQDDGVDPWDVENGAAPEAEDDLWKAHGEDLEHRIAELEAAVADTYSEFEPDGSEDVTPASADTILFSRRAQVFGEDEIEDAEIVDELPAPDVATGQSSPDDNDEVRAPEAPFAPETEPDTGGMAEDGAETADTVEGEGEASDDPEPLLLGEAEGDLLIDEETLREMVSDIVREELRGQVGENITRSMRRLIRREINRALTVRELD